MKAETRWSEGRIKKKTKRVRQGSMFKTDHLLMMYLLALSNVYNEGAFKWESSLGLSSTYKEKVRERKGGRRQRRRIRRTRGRVRRKRKEEREKKKKRKT